MIDNTFCPLPFCHINIKHNGKVSPCWRSPGKMGDYNKDRLEDIWNGEKIRKLRENLLNGNTPEECNSCWDFENNNIISTRTQALKDYNEITNFKKVIDKINSDYSLNISSVKSIELRFDNKCNLMCRHCSPIYSSKWEHACKTNDDLNEVKKNTNGYNKNIVNIYPSITTIEELIDISSNITELMIAGGEPLINSKFFDFCNKVKNTSNITMNVTSNFNNIELNGVNILESWIKFKKVNVKISIDGDSYCYGYNRPFGDIKKVENNIKKAQKYPNINLISTCTVSLLNITRFIKIIEYFLSLGTYFHTSLVQHPNSLNIKLLPTDLKRKITSEWNEWKINIDYNIKKQLKRGNIPKHKQRILKFGQITIDYMNSEDNYKQFNEFIEYVDLLDIYHNTNILDVYPEYHKYFKKRTVWN